MPRTQVVIAGSDELARELIALRLRRHGAQVIERLDGEGAAREVLRRPGGTTVVLVGELGDGTPAAFAEWLSEDEATDHVGLVVAAPHTRPDLASDARQAGADAVFTLPTDLDEIAAVTLELAAAAPAPALALAA